jgi:hypothetical protein
MGALLLVACGKVAEVSTDATSDALLDAFSCPTGMLACEDKCIDPMSDQANCGGCGVTCEANASSCQAGTCVDTITSCAQIHAITPAAVNGMYTLISGSQVYCDMTDGGVTYSEVDFGQVDSTPPPGYSLIPITDFQNPILQTAFISLFNLQGGAKLLASWTSGNCCFKFDTSANTFGLNADYFYPAHVGGAVDCSNGAYTDPVWTMAITSGATVVALPLPTNFFTTNVPSAIATGTAQACDSAAMPVDANPAFFWKKVMP